MPKSGSISMPCSRSVIAIRAKWWIVWLLRTCNSRLTEESMKLSLTAFGSASSIRTQMMRSP